MNAENGCWHCGEPLPADPPQARVAGVAHAVCCNGCRAVAEWIGELGLADYYRLRSGSAARAPDLGDSAKSAAAFQRPELSRHLVRPLADGNSEAIVLIDGMRCAACCWLIERTLGLLPGVADVGVNAGAQRARIVYDGKAVSLARDRRCARARRLSCAPARPRGARRYPAARNARRAKAPRRRRLRCDAGDDVRERAVVRRVRRRRRRDARLLPLADAARATPVVFYAAAPFFAGARRLLAARRLGMDVPVALAVALIYAGSVVEVVTGGPDVWFESVSMFVFFLCVGRYLEMRARHRAGDLSDALARLTPVFADRVEADGSLLRVGALELAPGDRVVVADGGSVPADGVLESARVPRRRGVALRRIGAAHKAPRRIAVRRQRRHGHTRRRARHACRRRHRRCRHRRADRARGEHAAAAGARRRARSGGFRRPRAGARGVHGDRLGDRRSRRARSRRRSRSSS